MRECLLTQCVGLFAALWTRKIFINPLMTSHYDASSSTVCKVNERPPPFMSLLMSFDFKEWRAHALTTFARMQFCGQATCDR